MVKGKRKGKAGVLRRIGRCWQLYVLMLPALVYIVLFAYKPMYGILIAFKDFSMKKGILASPWVGFKNFERLFSSYWFPIILKNTLTISLLSLVIGFPIPIILALLLNEVRSNKFRSMVQTFSYAPHFISMVVMCGMVAMFLSPTTGVVNKLLNALGMESVFFMQEAGLFKWVYVLSGVWQGTGWSSVIYFAALSGISPELHEAAKCDGATKFQIIRYIDFPSILPTATIQLILSCGSILSIGFEKAFALQNDLNTSVSEIISTYVYKVGMIDNNMSYSSAIGLFNTMVNLVILIIVNKAADKMSGTSLF